MTSRRAALASPLLLASCAHPPPDERSAMTLNTAMPLAEGQHPWSAAIPGLEAPMRGWLYLPPGYLASRQDWPLVVFLHGSGERGDDLARVTAHGLPKLAARGANYPFVLVSPQLPDGLRWEASVLHAMLACLRAGLRIDADRVTATGLSLGGYGVWDWATGYPNDLAGIAPVCGAGEPEDQCRMVHVPVRAYHGADDDVVPLAAQQASIDALRACGGTVGFTVYPHVGHGAWEPAYQDPALVPWLMARRRTRPMATTAHP